MSSVSLNEARVEDRALITAVIARYCWMATADADFEAMSALFTPSAQIRFPDGTHVTGPAAMRAALPARMPTFLRHHTTNIDIRFDGPRQAEVITLVVAFTNVAAPDHWGYWHDQFVKQDDGSWLIDDRSIVIEGVAPHGWLAATH